MGAAAALLRAAAFDRRILPRTRRESRRAVPALWIGRLPLFNGAAIARRCRSGRAGFVRQSPGLGRASAEMGMRWLGESRNGTSADQACGSLGLWKFRML